MSLQENIDQIMRHVVRGEDIERDVTHAFVVSRSDVEIIVRLYWGGWFGFL